MPIEGVLRVNRDLVRVDESPMTSNVSEQSLAGRGGIVAGSPAAMIGAACALSILVLALFWDFFSRQVEWAIVQQADWGHTLVIPIIAGWFVWRRRGRLLETPLRTTWLGLVVVVVGVALYNVSVFGPQVLHHHNLRGVSVGISIGGLLLLFLGWRAFALMLFPLAYWVIFGQTISDRLLRLITFKMQDWTAWGAHLFLVLVGADAERSGNTITVYRDGQPLPLNIAEACSGMRMLMAFLALGTAMAWAGVAGNFRRVLVIGCGVPIAIFVNILRVLTLGLLAIVDAGLAAGDFHSFVGLVWLVPAFLLFLGAMWLVRMILPHPGDDAEIPAPPAFRPGFDRHARTAFIAAIVVLAGGAVGLRAAATALDVYLRKLPVEMREHFDNIPRTLGSWVAFHESEKLSPEMIEELGTNLYFDRYYAKDRGSSARTTVASTDGAISLNVHLTYYTGLIDAVPHVPDRCLVAAGFNAKTHPVNVPITLDRSGWFEDPDRRRRDGSPVWYQVVPNRITSRPERIRMPDGEFALRTTQFTSDAEGVSIFAGYFFVANDEVTPNPEGVKRLAFRLDQKYAYYCKVQFTAIGDASLTEAAFVDASADLLAELLPHLMRCLPDWSRYETAREAE